MNTQMSKNVNILTLEQCPYCTTLKEKLNEQNIGYKEYDADTYEDLFFKLSEKSGSDSVPMVIVGKDLLVPEISFKTIDRAVELIKEKIND